MLDRMGASPSEDDVPRGTFGLPQAMARLRRASKGESYKVIYGDFSLASARELNSMDLELVLNELEGLQQYDPR